MRLKYLTVILLILLAAGAALFFKKNTQTKSDVVVKQDTIKVVESNQNLLIAVPPIRVGAVTWHTKNFVNKEVKIVGFVLKKENNYVLFSDEATGAITK
ncbi:MAG TPA: hypothetical protein VGO21_04940, partial [Candidatus Paceibacterota bacterium]|nr:hypothetical protein [Candidatus Paceibacterota bacterium]